MVAQCLDRRIPDKETLIPRSRHGSAGATASGHESWLFTVDRAREKLGRAYPRQPVTRQPARQTRSVNRQILCGRCSDDFTAGRAPPAASDPCRGTATSTSERHDVGQQRREIVPAIAAAAVELKLDAERLGERDAEARERRRDRRTPAAEDHHRERDVAAAARHVGREPTDDERQLRAARPGERAADERRRQPRPLRRHADRRRSASGRSPAARSRRPHRVRRTASGTSDRARSARAGTSGFVSDGVAVRRRRRRVRTLVIDRLEQEPRAAERDAR